VEKEETGTWIRGADRDIQEVWRNRLLFVKEARIGFNIV